MIDVSPKQNLMGSLKAKIMVKHTAARCTSMTNAPKCEESHRTLTL